MDLNLMDLNRNVQMDICCRFSNLDMTQWYCVLFQTWIMLQLTFFQTHGGQNTLEGGDAECCNGILGYAWHRPFMPCSEMRCCNSSETVALEIVNHAVGFCFRCMPKVRFLKECYEHGQEVATTNTSSVTYKTRTCCEGLKFKVIANSEDTAMVIRCVRR